MTKIIEYCPHCKKPATKKYGDGGIFGLIHGQWECFDCYKMTHPECPNCKKLNYSTAKFCMHCGCPLPDKKQEVKS